VFSGDEFRLVQQIVADYPALSVHELSLTICELLNWKRPNGRLKAHECRAWLQQLCTTGCLVLPALQRCGPKGPQRITGVELTAPETELCGPARALEPLRLDVVEAGSQDSARFRTWIAQHHYLGYRVPVGANLRYLGAFGQRPSVGLPAVVIAGLEDGSAGRLDQLEHHPTGAKSAVHRP
jgi:hypothetical protein